MDFDPTKFGAAFDAWVKAQSPAVEVAIVTLQSMLTGAGFGYLLGSMGSLTPPPAGSDPAMQQSLAAMQAGGPWGQARNLAALMGTNAGLTIAIKKARNGKEDVYGSMAASFGSGAVYSVVSGSPNPLQAALTTGMAFALFNGLFYQIGQMFKPEHADTEYDRGTYMLKNLGLQKYSDNLKKGLLTDGTIMLWNQNALQEAKIPPGPSLLILHHLDQFRNPASLLKPALPLPPLPPTPPIAVNQAAAVPSASQAVASR